MGRHSDNSIFFTVAVAAAVTLALSSASGLVMAQDPSGMPPMGSHSGSRSGGGWPGGSGSQPSWPGGSGSQPHWSGPPNPYFSPAPAYAPPPGGTANPQTKILNDILASLQPKTPLPAAPTCPANMQSGGLEAATVQIMHAMSDSDSILWFSGNFSASHYQNQFDATCLVTWWGEAVHTINMYNCAGDGAGDGHFAPWGPSMGSNSGWHGSGTSQFPPMGTGSGTFFPGDRDARAMSFHSGSQGSLPSVPPPPHGSGSLGSGSMPFQPSHGSGSLPFQPSRPPAATVPACLPFGSEAGCVMAHRKIRRTMALNALRQIYPSCFCTDDCPSATTYTFPNHWTPGPNQWTPGPTTLPQFSTPVPSGQQSNTPSPQASTPSSQASTPAPRQQTTPSPSGQQNTPVPAGQSTPSPQQVGTPAPPQQTPVPTTQRTSAPPQQTPVPTTQRTSAPPQRTLAPATATTRAPVQTTASPPKPTPAVSTSSAPATTTMTTTATKKPDDCDSSKAGSNCATIVATIYDESKFNADKLREDLADKYAMPKSLVRVTKLNATSVEVSFGGPNGAAIATDFEGNSTFAVQHGLRDLSRPSSSAENNNPEAAEDGAPSKLPMLIGIAVGALVLLGLVAYFIHKRRQGSSASGHQDFNMDYAGDDEAAFLSQFESSMSGHEMRRVEV